MRARLQAEPFGADAHRAAPDRVQRRRADDAGDRAAVPDDRDVDRELVAAVDEFAGAVERIDQDEGVQAVPAVSPCDAASSDTTAMPGSVRASPSRMIASGRFVGFGDRDWHRPWCGHWRRRFAHAHDRRAGL